MKRKNDFTIYYIVLAMFLVALFFGLACRITVLAAPLSDSSASDTEATTEDHLSQEELDHILRVSEKFLEKNGLVPDQATPSDAAEVMIGYIKDLKTKVIKTEEDFRNFIKEKINQINLDISEESRIYQENLK